MKEFQLSDYLLNEKKEIRKHFLEKRLALSKERIEKLSDSICFNAFINCYLLSGNVGLYHPIKNEVNPLMLINLGVSNISLPLIQNEKIVFKKWKKDDILKQDQFGMLQPLQISETLIPQTIIVPMIAFDERRFRIGYGGGFYDKFLENFKGLKIGLAFEMQKCKKIPEEKFDVKLDYIITENNIY